MGGISIVSKNADAALIAQGKLTDAEAGAQVSMIFPLPQTHRRSALHATGVPINVPSADSPFAGTGIFTPHIYVRNLLDSPQTVTLTVEFPGEASPQWKVLPPLVIPGLTTQDIPLDSYYNDLPLPLPFCAIRIQYNGPPGSMIADVVARNEDGKAMAIGAQNEGDGYPGSLASYWSFDENKDFYVFLTNMGDKDCRVGFRIEAGGVEYHLTRLKLSPRETKVINVRELRDRQEPDFRGNILPAHISEGRLMYIRLDNVPMMGRVVEVRRHKDHATK